MSIFSQRLSDFPHQQSEALAIDRLIDELEVQLKLESLADISSMKAAIFNLVVLSALLEELGIKKSVINPTIKEIRDSLMHIEERLRIFDHQSVNIKSGDWIEEQHPDGRFKLSATLNFQGAIDTAAVSTQGWVAVSAPYGLVNDYFIWIDREGHQQATKTEDIKSAFEKMVQMVSKND